MVSNLLPRSQYRRISFIHYSILDAHNFNCLKSIHKNVMHLTNEHQNKLLVRYSNLIMVK
jgi:hypothetical protein